jgi:hypothetical protein
MPILRASPGESLTLEEMERSLPSIFASNGRAGNGRFYEFISTTDVLARLMGAGFLPVEARSTGSIAGGRYGRHMVRLRGEADLAKPDNRFGQAGVAYEVVLRNSHDGTAAYWLYAGLIRFECENGLVVGDGTVQSTRVRHRNPAQATDKRIEAVRERIARRVVEGAQAILQQAPVVAEKIERWQAIKLDPEERLLLAREAHKARFSRDTRLSTEIKPEQLLIPRRPSEEGKRSVWDVGNIIQENVMQGGLIAVPVVRRKDHRRSTPSRPIREIDKDVRLNRTVWDLMEQAAKRAEGREKEWTAPPSPGMPVFANRG